VQEKLSHYLKAFKRLRLDRSHGVAPHKPILLLSVLQTYQNGINTDSRIYITPELVALFKTNWSLLVTTNHHCRISYPFYHLKTDKFWKLIPRLGFQSIDNLGSMVKTFVNLNAAIEYALIEEDLFLLMKDKLSNEIMQHFLLDEYFSNTKSKISQSAGIQQKLFDEIEDKILHEPAEEYQHEIKKLMQQENEEEIFLRGSLFKREIPKIYQNTCCISGMRIDALSSVSMVDACHIIPFSESFREEATSYSIKVFEGKEIQLPNMRQYFPKIDNLQWHFMNVFKK
jgi:putative restriction endonuclease